MNREDESFIGGMRWMRQGVIVTASWGTARLQVHPGGISLGPSVTWPGVWSIVLLPLFLLTRIIPRWEFAWSDITRVENTGRGVRLIVRGREDPIVFNRWAIRGYPRVDPLLHALERRGVMVDWQVKPATWSKL